MALALGSERLPVDRLADGTWLYAAAGELRFTADGAAVVCHACGEPLAWIGHAHLKRHGMTQETYRALFGLNRKQGLCAPAMAAKRADQGRERYAGNAALRDGLLMGQDMARDGRLNRLGLDAQPRGSRRTQGRKRATAALAAPGLADARRRVTGSARERWAASADALGYSSLEAYAEDRLIAGVSVSQMRREMGAGSRGMEGLLAEARGRLAGR